MLEGESSIIIASVNRVPVSNYFIQNMVIAITPGVY